VTPGTKFGHHEIIAPLGAGGMGEVYRARDTRLDRDVAIKVLPARLAQDAERLARFEREAKVLAALNHPNIAQIYGLEEGALIMELVEGSNLAGPLDRQTAVHYARQIADALEAAHEKGIVHRDLKPANIMITPAGVVKVLDFGLAAITAPSSQSTADAANSPTLTMAATQAGVILGTAAYMSPEQAAGKPVDRRADIWAFGVVLWEMLTGRQLFSGETVSHTLADVLKGEIDLGRLPRDTPPALRTLVKRCLDRDVRKRLRDIGEARVALEDGAAAEAPPPSAGRPIAWMAAAAVATLVAFAVSFVHFRETPPAAPVIRSFLPPPEGTVYHIGPGLGRAGVAALSPDGSRIAFAARSGDGKTALWVRPLDGLSGQPLAGTEGAIHPFWSPDSRYIGFFAGGKLKKIDASGGPAFSLCDALQPRGGSWSREGVIVFTPNAIGLHRVSASGGASTPLPNGAADGESKGRFPWFLPDGRHFLFTAGDEAGGGRTRLSIRVGSIGPRAGGPSKPLIEENSNAVYAQGYLLYLREDNLMAQPFDTASLTMTGEPVPVAEDIRSVGLNRRGVFSVSGNGLLVYQTGAGAGPGTLTWFDRSGKPVGTLGDPGSYGRPHLSPDRKTLAVDMQDPATTKWDLWMFDVDRQIRSRFTFLSQPPREGSRGPSASSAAIWSPDGKTVVFDASGSLNQRAANGSGPEALVYRGDRSVTPTSWSPDGRFILFNAPGDVRDPNAREAIWVLPMAPEHEGAERKPFRFLPKGVNDVDGQFSPDGRFVAYQSYESGRNEVSVASFNGREGDPAGRWRISVTGGGASRWRQDGKEIFFGSAGGVLMAAEVFIKGDSLQVGVVKPLFGPVGGAGRGYEVSADGQRFLMPTLAQRPDIAPLTLVQNWVHLVTPTAVR